ncbi:MAG: nucleotidyltransferase family protein [Ruminococcus sp.]|uniref:nucleotidyltransferase domain-containing protein n=1 Tax=Ruminococcus sp. TaxID=41978 RepID=UPI002872B505|nr:nucleotidyltransferase family protein [Ruminococcus sp.]MBQ3285201.1 nucleotidyltransferase family protein [Ruminococcus sp.]
MSVSNYFIIEILKAFLNDQKDLAVPVNVDWDNFNRLVEINSISGIVGYVFQQSDTGHIPSEIKEEYESDFLSTITIATMRDEDMKLLIDLLNNDGIDHLLFKGFIVKDLYTVPELRTYGDIDFAIRKESRGKSNSLMCRNGYQLLDDWEPVYSYEKNTEHYEIHTELLDSNLNNKCDYQSYFRGFWKHAICIGQHSFTLDPEFHLLYLLIHIAKHVYGSGAGIRMYLDIAFYLRAYRDQIDWEHFLQEVHTLGIDRFVNTVFTAVEKWFETRSPIPLKTLDDAFIDEFLTFTLNGGVFGYNGKAAKLSQVRKNSQGKSVKRVDTLRKRAFPSVDTIKSRYTYLDGKPWLLPIAWVHRFFRKKGTTSGYLRESKEILRTDKNEIVVLNNFYHEIGL